MDQDTQKAMAAAKAIEYVKDGMILGLGTGSTAAHFVKQLGEKVKEGLNVKGVPTSVATAELAKEVGVPLIDIEEITNIDLTVDGADEIDFKLNLIKGGGAALLREKIIAHASSHMVVIADESKMVFTLGKFPLPIEIIPFGTSITSEKVKRLLKSTGCKGHEVKIRTKKDSDEKVITDNGNYILDCYCDEITDVPSLSRLLNLIPGVVENGIFTAFEAAKRTIILGTPNGPRVIE